MQKKKGIMFKSTKKSPSNATTKLSTLKVKK